MPHPTPLIVPGLANAYAALAPLAEALLRVVEPILAKIQLREQPVRLEAAGIRFDRALQGLL